MRKIKKYKVKIEFIVGNRDENQIERCKRIINFHANEMVYWQKELKFWENRHQEEIKYLETQTKRK